MSVGDRVFVPSHNDWGTVVWIGALAGLNTQRICVELDSPISDASDGMYNNHVYYSNAKIGYCKFFKATVLRFGIEFHEAIEQRYTNRNETCETFGEGNGTFGKGIVSEFVGELAALEYFDKSVYTREFFCLDYLYVSCISKEVVLTYSMLKRISLTHNLIASLSFLSDLLFVAPNLCEVDLSHNRLVQDFALPILPTRLTELKLNSCNLSLCENFAKYLNTICPNLKELELAGNSVHASFFQSGKMCWLEALSLADCPLVGGLFEWGDSQLVRLNLSGNSWVAKLKTFPPLLQSLNISDCGITNWDFLHAIAISHLEMCELRVCENSFYTIEFRPIVVFLFPNLKCLNGTAVLDKHKLDAARYCANIVKRGEHVAFTLEQRARILAMFPSSSFDETTNSVHTNFRPVSLRLKVCHGPTPIDVRAPNSCTVAELVSIVARKIQWPLKLSELVLGASPSGPEDMILLKDCNDLMDTGIDSGWTLYICTH